LAFTVCCATAAHGAGSADGLLAYEPFAGQAGPLSRQSSGFGWSAGWSIQNNDVKVPGYNLAVSGPMQYIGLSQSGNYAVGGSTYQTAGRSLDVTPTGPFAQYLSSGTVGASGKSIWLSLLLRKDVNTDDEASATLLASQVAWWGQVGKISVGYFGQSSNS